MDDVDLDGLADSLAGMDIESLMSADPSDDPATSQEQFQEAGARFTSMGEHWKAKLESDPELAQFMSDLWSQIQALNEEHKGEEKELYERDIDELKESALEQCLSMSHQSTSYRRE